MHRFLSILIKVALLFGLYFFLLNLGSATLCYQDNANRSSSLDGTCVLNYSGNYNTTSGLGSFSNERNTYDNDTATYSQCIGDFGASCDLIETYIRPLNFSNSSFYYEVNDGSSHYLDIPFDCINYSSKNITLKASIGVCSVSDCSDGFYCYNGTWKYLYGQSNSGKYATAYYLYETGVYWDISGSGRNFTINSPVGLYTSLNNVPINISISNRTNLSNCWFNITKTNIARTLEVPNTNIPDCNYTLTNVTETISYYANICTNYTTGSLTCDSSLFFFNTPSTSSGGGGGGGSPLKIVADSLNATYTGAICEAKHPALTSSWVKFSDDFSMENLKNLWFAFWNYITCKSSASIVPF